MDTILITGGSGRIGSAVIEHANAAGYRTVSVDRVENKNDPDRFITADVTDAGQLYSVVAMASPDAIIHLGAIPNAGGDPDHVVYESNAIGAYHVLAAAAAVGVDTVCSASSIQAMGTSVEEWIEYLPVDEAHPMVPRNPYELGKQTVEQLSDGFARREGPPFSLATFRFPHVQTDEAFRQWLPQDPEDLEPGMGRFLFAYCAIDDVARLLLRAVETDLDGHERFWVSAPDTRTTVPTPTLIADHHPHAELRTEFADNDPLISTAKATNLLGWEPRISWRQWE